MAFLVLDGVTIPVFDGSPRLSTKKAGSKQRTFRGVVVNTERGHRRSWSFRAAFIKQHNTYDDAEAFERHVSGEGHLVTFEHGLAASTGLNPLPGYSITSWDATAGPDGTPGRIFIEVANSFLQYDAQLPSSGWSVRFLERDGTWSGAVYRSDFTGYLNGVVVGGGWNNTTWFTNVSVRVRDGVLTLRPKSTGNDVYFDGLMILPYKCSDAQAVAWSTVPGSEMIGPTPSMRMTGTLFGDQHTYVVGEVTGIEYVQKPTRAVGSLSTVHTNNAKIVSFDLYEVPRTYVRGDKL